MFGMKLVLCRRFPMKRKLILLMLVLLTLSGCSGKDNVETDGTTSIVSSIAGEYPVAVNYAASSTRNYHGTYLGSYDIIEIGSQLIDKSKKHFNVKDYILQEGQVINSDRLSNLVMRESTSNPSGLNPAKGSEFDIGDGTKILDPVLVADVVELNFLENSKDGLTIAGMSIAIVFNQIQKTETATSITTYEITQERLYQYATDVGRKLESYLRTLNQVGEIPIYIGLYSTKNVDAAVSGSYFGEGYFVSRSGQFKAINEKWLILPSNEVEKLDPQSSAFFSGFKRSLQQLLPESIGVIGKGRYINDKLDYIKIDIQLVGKTYMEIKASTQLAASIIEGMQNNDVHVIAKVTSLGKVVAIIEKKANQNKVLITYLES